MSSLYGKAEWLSLKYGRPRLAATYTNVSIQRCFFLLGFSNRCSQRLCNNQNRRFNVNHFKSPISALSRTFELVLRRNVSSTSNSGEEIVGHGKLEKNNLIKDNDLIHGDADLSTSTPRGSLVQSGYGLQNHKQFTVESIDDVLRLPFITNDATLAGSDDVDDTDVDDIELLRDTNEQISPELQDADESNYSSSHSFAAERLSFVASRPKLDLSYQAIRRSEAAINTEGIVRSRLAAPTLFRENAGMRSIVRQYMQYIEPILTMMPRTQAEDDNLDWGLVRVFDSTNLRLLQNRKYSVEDVALCSWILSAEHSETSVRRYVVAARNLRTNHWGSMPPFIPLQILRSNRIDSSALTLLVEEVEVALSCGSSWNRDSGAVLLIRLLRHARMTSASCYNRIAELVPRILPVEVEGNAHEDAQRLTHFYNRFLSLLALPLALHPFRSIDIQQQAQLKIARSMMDSPLSIQLNREGYRALARVQLLHQKTVQEQQWSSVKAPSWPPWRRDQMGIDATIEYPGRQSRASKVIKRLLEAGYGPESMEHEAQILAGWDTDKSPTIQVRKLTSRKPLAWIKKMLRPDSGQEDEIDHNIWAARVAATRSIREAWLCFYSYMQATMDHKRQLRVYHEMFYKLFARVQSSNQRVQPSPGDGKEVFSDPVSTRDLVYVPKEPPSIDELYAQMLQDGIQPAGRLLASLVDSARTLKQGLDFISNSSLGDVKKDLLLHPEKYPSYVIRNIISTMPDYFLASYVGLLTKRLASDEVRLYWPGSKSAEEHGSLPLTPVKPLLYGMTLMQIWKPTYLPAYHATLEGICSQAKARHPMTGAGSVRDHSYTELWKMAKHAVELIRQQRLQIDLICYRKLVLLVRNSMIRAPRQFGNESGEFADATSVIKSTFVEALHGRVEADKLLLPGRTLGTGRQPYWKDIEALILILGFGQDFSSILQVLNWIGKEHEHLECIDNSSYKMQRLLCATRIALEASWSHGKSASADKEQIQQARKFLDRWGWPEDVDVAEFVGHHRVWFEGARAAKSRQ